MRRVLSGLLLAAALGGLPAAAQDFPLEPLILGHEPSAGVAVFDWTPDTIGPPPLHPAADPESPAFIGPPAMAALDLLGGSVAPGTRARLEWRASQSFSGGEVVSPVMVAHGVRPGPVLCLTAAVHGDELNGVEIVRRVLNAVEPQTLGGTLVGVPIVNLFGFSRNSRYLPDRRDLNRHFPGSHRGSIAGRIAASFFDNVARHCDALVDFHTGSFDRSNLPQIRADLTIPSVREFTRGFGATAVLHSPGSRGMLRNAAIAAGIPAVTFEVGAPMQLQPQEIEHGVQAVNTLLHKLGMTADLPAWAEPQPIFYESVWVRSNAGGMLISDVVLGQRVREGDRLGRVIDPLANTERALHSPVTGRVIGMAQNQVVLPGYAAYHVGEETSEERAVREAAEGVSEFDGEEEDPAPEADEDPRGREPDEDALPPEFDGGE